MPTVTMPDGTLVDMPDTIDAQLGARLRAFHAAHTQKAPQDYDPTPAGGVPEGFHEIRTNGAPYIVHDQTVADTLRALSDLPGVGAAERFGQGATRLAGKAASGIAGLFGADPKEIQQTVNQATELPPSNDPLVQAGGLLERGASAMAAPVDRAVSNLPPGPRTAIEATEEAIPDIASVLGARGVAPEAAAGAAPIARSAEEVAKAAGYTGLKTRMDLRMPGNQAITDALISQDAGMVPGHTPSVTALENAIKVGPARVYRQAEADIPHLLTMDEPLQTDLSDLPQQVSQLPRSPDVEALQETMLAQPEFTRDELFANIREARERAKAHWKSDDPDKSALGDAYHALANAYEDFAGRQLEASGSEVTLPDWLAARTQMAKNYQAQGALRGEHFDPAVYARTAEKNPHLLTGNAAIVGHVAKGLPTADMGGGDGLMAAGLGAAAGESAGHFAGVPVVGGIAGAVAGPMLRARLEQLRTRGDPTAAAGTRTNPALSYFFNPGQMPPGWNRSPVAPRIAGLLPSPAMVNAGGGASTASALENLGLTPDVRAAGAQHPGVARLQALREQLEQLEQSPERPAEPVDFQGPQKWGDFSIAPQQPSNAVSAPEGIPFENVLEQGGTQRPPIGAPQTGYRPPSKSPKQNAMRTPPGEPTLAVGPPPGPSPAQLAFRNKLAADRLRKVAGDLSVEGPGGSTGDPLARIREAHKRRERGYAEGGDVVRGSSSPGSPGVSGAVRDALAALRNYLIDRPRRETQAQREQYENTVVDDTNTTLHPRAVDAHQNYAGGGEVAGIAEKLAQLLARAREWINPTVVAAKSAPLPTAEHFDLMRRFRSAPGAPNQLSLEEMNRLIGGLSQAPTEAEILDHPEQRPLLTDAQTQQLLEPSQAKAGGGPVEETPSSIRRLADAARGLDNPSGTDPNAENRARVATNLASLVYGLDAQGRPALGGRAWTKSQGGTPAGVLDAVTAVPHNLVQLAALADKYLPGKSNPQFWSSIDPAWSRQAADRLSQLRQRLQQSAGVAPAKSFTDTALDMATDPAMVAPMGAAKVVGESPILRRALQWGTGDTGDPVKPTQGYAKGGRVRKEVQVRPIQDLPRDKDGMFIQPDKLTDEIAVWVEHNRQRAEKAYYADEYCGKAKTVDPARKYNCGGCNQADGGKCLFVYDDKKKGNPPLLINRAKGSCGPWEIIDRDDPEQRGNRMPASIAGYAVRVGGGPDEVFSCAQCWKGVASKWAPILKRSTWCGEWGTTVQPGACCVVNGAPTVER